MVSEVKSREGKVCRESARGGLWHPLAMDCCTIFLFRVAV